VVGLPLAALYLISQSWIGLEVGFLGVNIVMSVMTIPIIIWDLIKIVPNLALLRTKNVLLLLMEVIIQVVALVCYWLVYASIAA
jgi:hypothetical protein